MKEKLLKSKLKKHPQWLKLFEIYLQEDSSIQLGRIEQCFNNIINYKALFKGLIDDAHSYIELNDNRSVMERLEDKINKDIHNHKKEKFIKSLKTQTYQHLFNQQVEQEIHLILDNKISVSALKSQFFNKLARYDESEDLLEDLQKFKEKNIGWNKEFYLDKIKNEKLNVKILDDQHGYMIIEVEDYQACQSLGSQAWCIVEDELNFDFYTNDGFNRQVIALNFDLPLEDNTSIIGLTIEIDGTIETSYLKDDSETEYSLKKQFKFDKLSNSIIESYLSTKNDSEAFSLVCKHGLIEFYDNYIDKLTIDNIVQKNLSDASKYNHTNIIEKILSHPNINTLKTSFIEHKLNKAAETSIENGSIDVFNIFIKHEYFDPNFENGTFLQKLSIAGYPNELKKILEQERLILEEEDTRSMLFAVKYERPDILKTLLEDNRVDPSIKNNEVLRMASERDSVESLELLLNHPKIDPSDLNNYAIRYATFYGNINVLNRLLKDKRVDPTVENNYVLKTSIEIKEDAITELLLKDERVCNNIDKEWLKKHVTKEQLLIFNETRSNKKQKRSEIKLGKKI